LCRFLFSVHAEGLVLSALDDNKKENLARLCGIASAGSHKKVITCACLLSIVIILETIVASFASQGY